MENTNLDSTSQRPEGGRVIASSLVYSDLDEYTRILKEESTWQESDRNAITLFKAHHMSMVLVCLHEKAEMVSKPVNGYITIFVKEGKIRLVTSEGDIDMRQNQVATVHPFIEHSILALDDAVIVLSNSSMHEHDQ